MLFYLTDKISTVLATCVLIFCVFMWLDQTFAPPHLDVVRADVDLALAPVRASVDDHPRLGPLELVAEPDGDNLDTAQQMSTFY